MALHLFNTLTRTIEPLAPLREGELSMYSCGPTVYDHVHIGNLSAFIVADTLRRVAIASGAKVKHVMNFTDVDDKTIRRSKETYPDMDPMAALNTLTTTYGDFFVKAMEQVGNDTSALTFIKAADQATIAAMQQIITDLYKKGFAYIADDGVYFSIASYQDSGKTYGQLTEISEASTSSERIQNDEYDKESAHDFALWKKKKDGEPSWEFSLDDHNLEGRPGWHIECSAMSRLELGQPFDIHTGGIDLIFPHHENEIAQSTAGEPNPVYAGIFVHNEHILVDGKKMAKSANNFYTLEDLIEKNVAPLAFRLLVLQSHYQKSTNFTLENAEAAHNRLKHWREIAALRWQTSVAGEGDIAPQSKAAAADILAAMEDNLNTPEALRIIDALFSEIEMTPHTALSQNAFVSLLTTIDDLLGLHLIASTPDIDNETKTLIAKRQAARQESNWQVSDEIRDQLLSKSIAVRDTASGTVWSYTE